MKVKKLICGVSLILAASCILCSCQSSKAQTETEVDESLPELKIGVDILRPFFYIDENGDYAGIDAEIAEEACRRAGYTPDFVQVSWAERDSYLQDKRVDCLWSAFIKDGREDQYQWTDSYLQTNLRTIVNDKSPDKDIQSLPSFAGMAVRAGSKLEELLLDTTGDFPETQVYSCGTFEMAETAFVKGYVGGLGGHEVVLQEFMNEYAGQYRFLDGTIMTANLGVAFRKDDTSEHWEKINNAIRDMIADNTITEIYDKYNTVSDNGKEDSADDQK